MKLASLLLPIGLLLIGCSTVPGAPPAPDYGPVGDGLKVIGYALVAVAVLLVLSTFIS